MRTILERCLDPDPARRYRRAWELAEDLDRWRTNRPLAFTAEPFWSQSLPRWMRRQRRAILLTVAAVSLIVGLPTAAIVSLKSWSNLLSIALHELARYWDDPKAYPFARSILDCAGPAPIEGVLLPDRTESFANGRRGSPVLLDYNVLGAEDWRQRDDVRVLPVADREDLELWLLEQAYRYCRALDDHPNSPKDWQRACDIIERLEANGPLSALTALSHHLRVKLGRKAPAERLREAGSRTRSKFVTATAAPASRELEEYLLGVAAECSPSATARGRGRRHFRKAEHRKRACQLQSRA